MTTPTPLQRLSEIVEGASAIDWPDFDEHGDAMVVAGCQLARFLASPEAVEVLARAISAAQDDDDWWSDSATEAKAILNIIAEQALKESK